MIKLKRQKSLIWHRILSLFLTLCFITGAMAQNSGVHAVDRKKVDIQSSGYSSEEPGSWHIKKAAEWAGYGRAKVTLDLDTIFKKGKNYKKDVILVLDVSGSMQGDKIRKVKEDANDLIDKFIDTDPINRIALVKFEDNGTKLTDFSRNKAELASAINALVEGGQTNYYDALVKAEDILTADNNGAGYQKVQDKDLVVLLLTDGCPNTDHPLQIGQYNKLKSIYPYIQINGIQYELGKDIAQDLIDVSDRQYYADMSTLHSVLFEALAVSEKYENMQVVDYIDTNYFTLSSPSNVFTNIGTVEVEKNDSDEYYKVIWNLGEVVTGTGAELKMYLNLKPGLDPSIIDLPTNTGEDVTVNDSTSTFDKTPILEKYNVHYDANKPETARGTETHDEMHLPLETVTKSWPEAESFAGWIFKGWEYADPLPEKRVGNDAFIMPEANAYINGTWSKFDISKSMDGSIEKELKIATIVDETYDSANYTSQATDTFSGRLNVGALYHRSHSAYLWDGEMVNGVEIKDPVSFEHKDRSSIKTNEDNSELKVDQITKRKDDYDNEIYEFYYDEIQYGGNVFEGIQLQTADSPYKVWVWLDQVTDPDNPKVYWSSDADMVKFPDNANCQYAFSYNRGLETIDLSDFDLSTVQNVYCMFYDVGYVEAIYVNPDPAKRFKNPDELNGGYNNRMFSCRNLKGQSGTTWSYQNHDTKYYAVVDKEDGSTPGLLSIRPDLRD